MDDGFDRVSGTQSPIREERVATPPVAGGFDRIDAALERLDGVVSALSSRLGPVMAEESPAAAPNLGPDVVGSSEVARRASLYAEAIELQRGRLASILERLEV